MRILLEGEKYDIADLNLVFGDSRFYVQTGSHGKITHVGYYHSLEKNEIIYMLPKVFIDQDRIFGKYSPGELFSRKLEFSLNTDQEYDWARRLLIYFYNSLSEFRRRYSENTILQAGESLGLTTNLVAHEYSYLDLVLGFVNHYRRNRNAILFQHIDFTSRQARKPRWEKTVRRHIPLLNDRNEPLYLDIRNKKKVKDDTEQLICYFFSILNHFSEEHGLDITINKAYKIITGSSFERLKMTGLNKLRSIKHRYFADTLKRMYQLCELYFSKTSKASILYRKEEFIAVRNYNLVFEDMIDKLFSDPLPHTSDTAGGISLHQLKHHADGKILDHIYEYQSLVDTSNIFFIGDSKYYRPGNEAGAVSIFKQFTYAKNIIQYNINLFIKEQHYYSPKMFYRDEITEGYNITPNFFIYGYIGDPGDFDNDRIEPYGAPEKSSHFPNRLFDRDTLFVHQYRINFLFVLKAYSAAQSLHSREFKQKTKEMFRNGFIEYFNDPLQCGFELFSRIFQPGELEEFVAGNFRELNGRCLSVNGNELLIAKYADDSTIDALLDQFGRKVIS